MRRRVTTAITIAVILAGILLTAGSARAVTGCSIVGSQTLPDYVGANAYYDDIAPDSTVYFFADWGDGTWDYTYNHFGGSLGTGHPYSLPGHYVVWLQVDGDVSGYCTGTYFDAYIS
jgi:hypothetical protein